MDAVNQILNETFYYLKTINGLKNNLWVHVKALDEDKPILRLFNRISSYNRANYIQKHEIATFMLPKSVDPGFMSYFYHMSAQTDYIMTFIDFQNYLLKFISLQGNIQLTPTNRTVEELFRGIITAEESFHAGIQPFKKRLTSQFRDVSELFNFLNVLFEDVSTYSNRAGANVVDFAKLNSQVRVKNNHPVITLTEMSYYVSYYQMCDDGGITFDEFLSMFIDSENLTRYYLYKLDKSMVDVQRTPFLSINMVPTNRPVGDHNLVLEPEDEDFKIKPSKKFLKNMLMEGFDSRKEEDAILLQQEIKPVHATSSTISGPKKIMKQNFLSEEKQKNVHFKRPKSDMRKFEYKFVFIDEIEHEDAEEDINEISMQQSIKNNVSQADSFIYRNLDEFKY